jgi:radical SAM protein with 4Fe4S-binding SPASM domain
MSMPQQPYCSAPWNGLTIREDGRVLTCCVGKITLGNLNNQTMSEIEKSSTLVEIRNSLLAGQSHTNCSQCVESENKKNYATLRAHYQKFYPDIGSDLKLRFIDVRWNNRCNIACMYCNPTFSSTWGNRLNLVNNNSAASDYQDQLLQWILDKCDQTNEIMLVGGEPMLMKQNYALLKKLPAECCISIITNLAYDLEQLPCFDDLVKRPADNIIWNLSMENTESQFEYVRTGSNWDQTVKNIKLMSTLWPNTLSLNFVYSVFSAFDIVNTAKYFSDLGVKKINLQPINRNTAMDVFGMPLAVRKHAQRQLIELIQWHQTEYNVDSEMYNINGIESIISGLDKSPNQTVTLNEFLTQLDWYDQYSSTKFSNLWPNEYDLITQHLT